MRKFGVPAGGWFDAESAQVANLLVQQPLDAKCLELCMARFAFLSRVGFAFALSGAPCEVRIDGQMAGHGGLFWADPDELVRIDPPPRGARAYFSAAFSNLPSAGSRLKVGDGLLVEDLEDSPRRFRLAEPESGSGPIRIVPGPQASLFDLGAFASAEFTVSPRSNRVGLRLVEIFEAHAHELPSEPAGCGAIQITPDGGVIVLGPDGPTIGGYPKAAYVISADFDRLAQLRPEERIAWELVDVELARRIGAEHTTRIERRLAELTQAVKQM